jgi:polysaccharide export outer membrane protein
MQARVAQAKKDVDDFTRKLQIIDDQRRVQLLQELQEATTKSATARYRFEAAAEKVKYSAGAQNSSTAPADPPKITIHRAVSGNQRQLSAEEATRLSPGDNIEIVTKVKPDKPAAAQGPIRYRAVLSDRPSRVCLLADRPPTGVTSNGR